MGADPRLLTEVPIFSLLDERERATLAERVETVKFAAGTPIFNRGDPGDSLYVVSSGAVEIFFKNDTGERIVLEIATPGHFFGEISLLDGGDRLATVTAKTPLKLLVLSRHNFNEMLETAMPEVTPRLLQVVGERMRLFAQHEGKPAIGY